MKFRYITDTDGIRPQTYMKAKKNNIVFEIHDYRSGNYYVTAEHCKSDITYNSLLDKVTFPSIVEAQNFCKSFNPKNIACHGADAPKQRQADSTYVGNVPQQTLDRVANIKRYNTSDKTMVIAVAARESIKDGKDYYVFCTTNGYELTSDRESIPGNPNMFILRGNKIYRNAIHSQVI